MSKKVIVLVNKTKYLKFIHIFININEIHSVIFVVISI